MLTIGYKDRTLALYGNDLNLRPTCSRLLSRAFFMECCRFEVWMCFLSAVVGIKMNQLRYIGSIIVGHSR